MSTVDDRAAGNGCTRIYTRTRTLSWAVVGNVGGRETVATTMWCILVAVLIVKLLLEEKGLLRLSMGHLLSLTSIPIYMLVCSHTHMPTNTGTACHQK